MKQHFLFVVLFAVSSSFFGQSGYAVLTGDPESSLHKIGNDGCLEESDCSQVSLDFNTFAMTPSGRLIGYDYGYIKEVDTLTCESSILMNTYLIYTPNAMCALDEEHLATIGTSQDAILIVFDLVNEDYVVIDSTHLHIEGDLVFIDGSIYCTVNYDYEGYSMAKINLNSSFTEVLSIDYLDPEGIPGELGFYGLAAFKTEDGDPLVIMHADNGTTWIYDIVQNTVTFHCESVGFFTYDSASTGKQVLTLSTETAPVEPINPDIQITVNTSFLDVHFNTPTQQQLDVFVYDMQGRVLMADQLNPGIVTGQLNISTLSRGAYFLEVRGGETVCRKKFMVQE